MKKIYLKRLAGILVFLLITGFLLIKASNMTNSTMIVSQPVPVFYEQEKNTIDVVALGSSHTYRSFSPMQLWEETGITGFTLSTIQQTIPGSYYLLREAIRTQHPKLVLLELYGALMNDHYKPIRVHYVMDHMAPGRAKLEMVRDYLMRELSLIDCMEYIFPFLMYHSRWDACNLTPPYRCLKGFAPTNAKHKMKEPSVISELSEEGCDDMTQEYLDKIIELCRAEGVELLFYQTPMADSDYYQRDMMRSNTIIQYLTEQGCNVINFEELRREIGLDYKKDFYNTTHLNSSGAGKIMSYLAPYIAEHYELEDHRQDPAYASWNEDLEEYHRITAEFKGSGEESAGTGEAEAAQ